MVGTINHHTIKLCCRLLALQIWLVGNFAGISDTFSRPHQCHEFSLYGLGRWEVGGLGGGGEWGAEGRFFQSWA